MAFDLEGRLYSQLSRFYRLCGRLAAILIACALLMITPPKRSAVLF